MPCAYYSLLIPVLFFIYLCQENLDAMQCNQKFQIEFFSCKLFSQSYLWFYVYYLENQSFYHNSTPQGYTIKINFIEVVLLHFMVFNLTVISAYFKVCNNDNSSVTSSIVLLLLLLSLSLNMFWSHVCCWDNLRYCCICYYILCCRNSASIIVEYMTCTQKSVCSN